MFGGNFAPAQWALCNGQLMAISEFAALFSLLGTTYGGNGTTNFALPDLRGRLPIHMGQGPGLSTYVIGQVGGAENVTLNSTSMPTHQHSLMASQNTATSLTPSGNTFAATPVPTPGATVFYESGGGSTGSLDPSTVGTAGSNQSHANLMPFLCVNFIIALAGIFPSRN